VRRALENTVSHTIGNRATAQRIVNAENSFVETLMRCGQVERADAEKAMRVMLKLKVAKLDPIIGVINVKHGVYLEPDVIRNAVNY
jgi:hypothetical protein